MRTGIFALFEKANIGQNGSGSASPRGDQLESVKRTKHQTKNDQTTIKIYRIHRIYQIYAKFLACGVGPMRQLARCNSYPNLTSQFARIHLVSEHPIGVHKYTAKGALQGD